MPNTNKIVIFADAGARQGLGHLGRCAAIAQGLKAATKTPAVFFLKDPVARKWAAARGLETVSTLPSKMDRLIVDSYRVTPQEFRELRRRAQTLIVVDDNGGTRMATDWVLNTTPFAQGRDYKAVPSEHLMLGPSFHPLRKEFWNLSSVRAPKRVSNILIVLGGGDAGNCLPKLVTYVLQTIPRAMIHVVIGPYTSSPKPSSRVRVYRSPKNMRPIMRRCDLAISAAGQTIYELAACGVPTLAIQMADNQKRNYEGFQKLGIIQGVGTIQDARLFQKLGQAIRRVISDPSLRRQMSSRAQACIDGNGAKRIARALAS